MPIWSANHQQRKGDEKFEILFISDDAFKQRPQIHTLHVTVYKGGDCKGKGALRVRVSGFQRVGAIITTTIFVQAPVAA